MAKYLSNRQQNLKIGIVSYTEDKTVLEVTGKVGIGTTNATRTLDVNGDIRVRGGLYDVNNQSGTSGQLLVSTATGVDWQDATEITVIQNILNTTLTGIGISEEGVGIGTTFTRINFIGPGVTASANGTSVNVTVADYVSNAGVSTSVIGGIGSITQLQVTGVSTFTNGPILVGTASSTGTASQRLQVTGGAYVSGNLGVGVINPAANTQVAIAGTLGIDAVGNAGTRTLLSSSSAGFVLNHNDNSNIDFRVLSTSKLQYQYSPNFWTIPAGVSFLVGTATSTGTASQPLQVTGSAYVSGSVGIGTTNAITQLHLSGFSTTNSNLKIGSLEFQNYSLNNSFFGDNVYWNGSAMVRRSTGAAGLFYFIGDEGQFRLSPVGLAGSETVNSPQLKINSNGEFGIGSSLSQTANNFTGANFYVNPQGVVLVGTISSTGTASQRLQVTGGAYVSGSVGIGTTNPTSKLHVVGDVRVSGVVTATTFVGALTGTATSTTNIPNLTGDISSVNTATTLATVNSNVGTFGGTGAIPVVTVNAKGLVTGVSTVAPNNGTLTLAVSGTGLSGLGTFTANQAGASSFTVTSNATNANTVSTIVARDASGNFSAGTITASLTGTATSTTNIPNLTGAITSNNTTTSLGSFSSANLATALTDKTGSGANVFATSPVLVTPSLGAASATSINSSGIVTATQFVTGASGSAIGINTNTISGPATITIDPAAVGDNTGLVVIKGDLQIDGTTTTINSTTVTVDDKNIILGSGAINDAAADGSGITIESGNGNKTFQFEDTGDNLGSSENINVASGKVYKINNTSVLSSTTLGSGVVNSSLTSVGTLGQLSVSGVSTFTNANNAAIQIRSGASGSYTALGIGRVTEEGTFAIASDAGIYANNAAAGDIVIRNSNTSGKVLFTRAGANASLAVAGDNVLVGTISSTGTASQPLQVTGGAYVSGNLGVGNTNPGEKLQVDGNIRIGVSTTSNYIAFRGTTGDGPGSYNYTYIGERIWSTGTERSELLLFKGNDSDTTSGPDRIRLAASQVRIDTYTTATSGTFEGVGISTTLINRVVVHSTGEVGIGTDVLTGTASQPLQVTGGAYVSGSVGIGTTNPTSKLHVVGDARITGVVTATTFVGALTGTATSTTNIPNLTGAITSNNTTTSLGSFSSANLATALTDETGTGSAVFATSPVLVTPALGVATATSINVSGIATINQLDVNQLSPDGSNYGTVLYVPVANGSGGWNWATVASAGAGNLNGIDIREEGTIVGTAGSTTSIDFRGNNIIATGTAGGAIATVRVSDTPTFDSLVVSSGSTFTNGPILVGTATSTGTASQRLQVTGGAYVSGNLGVGNTNPQNTLDVGVGTIRLINKSSTGRFSQIYQDNNLIFSNSSTNDDFDWTNSSGSRMRLYGTGNLVIPGTFTPTGTASQRLQVDGGAYVSGNLGIGTTNPGEKLQVDGNIRIGVSTTSNYIAFRGTTGDNPGSYNYTYIGERIWSTGTERSELLLFKGNDSDTTSGPDRIRLAASQVRIDTYTTATSGTFEGVGISTTLINRVVVHSTGEVGIGTDVLTGTASQSLQVTGGAYVSGNLGVGVTNPTSKLSVVGDGNFTGVVTATTFVGALTGTATSTTNIPNLTGDITSVNSVTSIAAGVIVDADINASAGIVDTKLATISTALKVSNSATTATNANTNNAIVARDASGNFSAGTITANLTGTATSTTNIPNLTGAITSVNTTTSLGSFTSSQLATALTDETGSGSAVFATSPTLVTPSLGAASATSIISSGIITATQFVTGTSGSAIGINTNTISGPATITIDPAAVGDNTGLVVIKGDLQIDGTTTTINSTTVTVDDKNIILGSGAINDAAADGSGITIESGNGNKTFQFEDAGDNLGSSENLNVASGKVYKVNNTSVLSATTLGSGVVNSSLTSVGTLGQLQVTGVSTFTNGPILVGTGTSTGTASQRLQVDGGAYVSGSVGIGTTNPLAKFHVSTGTLPTGLGALPTGTRIISDVNTGSNYFTFRNTSNNTTYAGLLFQDDNIGGYVVQRNAGDSNIDFDSLLYGAVQDHVFKTGSIGISGAGTEVVRIKQSGSVGIGTNNPVATLQVKDALAFETTNTTTTSTSQVAVDTFATATFRSAKYQVQMTCPGQLATLGGITTGGSGYTAGTFNVTFSNSSGTGAAAQGTLTISNGTVSQIGVGTTGGSGYTAGDVLTAAGGSGLQVSVASTASPSGRILTLGAITSAGIGYTSGVGVGTTTLAFLGGTGTGAVGLATIFDGVITSSTLLQQPTTGTGGTVFYSGSNYTTSTVLTIAKTDVTNTIITIAGSVGVSTFTSLTAHGIGVSDTVRVSSTSNGLTAGTNYFVVTTPTTTTFTLGSSVGIGTTFTTGSSLSLGFYRNSANAGGSVAYLNAITGVSTNFQVSDLMVLQNGTTADFVEYGTIANNDVLGTFAADISGANTRLLVTPTYATNTVKVARQAVTV